MLLVRRFEVIFPHTRASGARTNDEVPTIDKFVDGSFYFECYIPSQLDCAGHNLCDFNRLSIEVLTWT